MLTEYALPTAALLAGLVAGMAVNRLLCFRAGFFPAPAGSPRPPASPMRLANPRAWMNWLLPNESPGKGTLPSWVLWANPAVLGGASLALAVSPGLRTPFELSQALLMAYLLYPLAWVDVLTLTVESTLVMAGIVLRFASLLALQPGLALEMGGGMLGGAGMLYLVGFFYRELRGREGLGEGDAALMGLIGGFVGWQGLLPVLLLSTIAGLLTGTGVLLALRKPLATPLPFAPFLCAGGLLVYLMTAYGISFRGFFSWWA